MKSVFKSALILAALGVLGCKKEAEVVASSLKDSTQPRELVLVNLGSSWDWYAEPPDPEVFWEYPRWENVRIVDVTDWEPGKDAVELGGSSSEWRDTRNKFYYPWQGEDTIYHFVTGPYLWVNGKRVGVRLWEVYYGDIPDPEDIITVVADLSEVRYFKHLPNLEAAHVIIFPGWINELNLLKICLFGWTYRNVDYPRLCQDIFNLYWGWIELHYFRDRPKLYLTSKPMHDIWFVDEEPSNYDIARFSNIRNVRGLDIGSYQLRSSGLSRVLPRFAELKKLKLAMPDIDERILRSISRMSTLRNLTLRGGWAEQGFDKEALSNLEKLTDLKELELSSLPVDDTVFSCLALLPNLRSLNLDHSDVRNADLSRLYDLTRLAELRIDSDEITDSAITHLEKIKTLERLELCNTKVTDEGVARLKKALPECVIVRTEYYRYY